MRRTSIGQGTAHSGRRARLAQPIEVSVEDLAANWPARRKARAFASTFRSRSLDHRNDQLDTDTVR